jgi:hypothetical protein
MLLSTWQSVIISENDDESDSNLPFSMPFSSEILPDRMADIDMMVLTGEYRRTGE